MSIVKLPEDIKELLDIIQGESYEEKIKVLAIEKIRSNLEECNKNILRYETKYGMTFEEFKKLWDEDKIENKFSHEVETDYIEWEALEMEKKHWLSLLRRIKV